MMSEPLKKPLSLIQQILELGRTYDSQRSGTRRGLYIEQYNRNGLFEAQWTNKVPGDEHWTLGAPGHDEDQAMRGLIRRLERETGIDSGKHRVIR